MCQACIMPFHFHKNNLCYKHNYPHFAYENIEAYRFKYHVQGHMDCSEANHILEVTTGLQLELEPKFLTTIL